MKVDICKKRGVTILNIEGKIRGAESMSLQDTIAGKIAAAVDRETKLILNVGKADIVDSAGLGAIVFANTVAREKGGRVALLNVGRLKNLIAMAKLMMVFAHYNSETEALASFQ